MLEWQPIIDAGIKALAPKLIESAVTAASRTFTNLSPYKLLHFDKHFQIAFERCTKVKTIVNGDKPINLLEHYVNPNFRQKDRTFDEYQFIDAIWDNSRVALIGAAGSGKSMFMRYFWVTCTIHPRGKIPIYVELRKFNENYNEDFTTFIFNIAVDSEDKETRGLFKKSIEEGQFAFIFDGFDEIEPKKRRAVESAILKLSEYKNLIIVSSRPDEIFNSWQSFISYEMMPLSLEQTSLLVQRIDFDIEIKNKFVQRLRNDLYERHESFASRPLLATMMLLTFSSYADVPEKIHVFYDQAFDTLFSRHDSTKEAFNRVRRTDCSIDIFKKILSYFCLITYNDNKTEFSESEALEALTKVSQLENITFDGAAFLADLLNAVCILQRDGLKIVFSHRSFQEYFCAYRLARFPERQVGELIGRFSSRQSDSVLPMLFDMDSHLVNRTYIYPTLKQYQKVTSKIATSFVLSEFLMLLGASIAMKHASFSRPSRQILIEFFPEKNEFLCLRAVIMKLYPNIITEIARLHSNNIRAIFDTNTYLLSSKDYIKFGETVLPFLRKISRSANYMVQTDFTEMKYRNFSRSPKGLKTVSCEGDTLAAFLNWIDQSLFSSQIKYEHFEYLKLCTDLKDELESQSKSLSEILGVSL